MPNLEVEVKEKVIRLLTKRSWQQVCLLILSLVDEGKLASKMFIYNKLVKWELVDLKNKTKDLKSISSALYLLHKNRLIKKEDISRFEENRFRKYCAKHTFGTIIFSPKKNRTQLIFRLPTKFEEKEIQKMNNFFRLRRGNKGNRKSNARA